MQVPIRRGVEREATRRERASRLRELAQLLRTLRELQALRIKRYRILGQQQALKSAPSQGLQRGEHTGERTVRQTDKAALATGTPAGHAASRLANRGLTRRERASRLRELAFKLRLLRQLQGLRLKRFRIQGQQQALKSAPSQNLRETERTGASEPIATTRRPADRAALATARSGRDTRTSPLREAISAALREVDQARSRYLAVLGDVMHLLSVVGRRKLSVAERNALKTVIQAARSELGAAQSHVNALGRLLETRGERQSTREIRAAKEALSAVQRELAARLRQLDALERALRDPAVTKADQRQLDALGRALRESPLTNADPRHLDRVLRATPRSPAPDSLAAAREFERPRFGLAGLAPTPISTDAHLEELRAAGGRLIEQVRRIRDQRAAHSASRPQGPLIVFVCARHDGPSQMAAALFDATGVAGQAVSGGILPAARVSPLVVEALAEIGMRLIWPAPRQVEPRELADAERVIWLGLESCPLGPDEAEHWAIGALAGLDLAGASRLRDALRERITDLASTGLTKG